MPELIKLTTLTAIEAQAAAVCLDSFFIDDQTLVLEMATDDWWTLSAQLADGFQINVNDLSSIGNEGNVEITLSTRTVGARS